ncbi:MULTISPECIES: alpha/beta fold hydrolase [Kitasatospora]|uniref:alpha/beta fold hydrolase n=2 Tax=Kitasatospora albolonga TaxID=68173 RepID=UPI0035E8EB49
MNSTTGRKAALAATATAVAVTSLTSLAPAVAEDRHGSEPKPTVVLVHGAFADASGWNDTADRLRRLGFPVKAVANPLRGPANDAAYLQGLLKGVKGPKILVGHSYGGAVITNAAPGIADVKALVYVAAFMPAEGESLGGLLAGAGAPDLPAQPFEYTRPDGTVSTEIALDPERFRDTFAADVPAGAAAQMAAAQRPIAAEAFGQPLKQAGWKTVPTWVLVARNDHALPPALQRTMAARAKARTTEVASSHALMVSHPGAVADAVRDAYRSTR